MSFAAKVLDDETRRKVEAQKARMASADEAPTITPKESADLMRELIDILLPGETVTRALKRLRPVKAKGGLLSAEEVLLNILAFKERMMTASVICRQKPFLPIE